MIPQVHNMRHGTAPEDAIYVGRPSKYGNPYRVTEALVRERAVELYRGYINAPEQRDLRRQIRLELAGKDLVCWCRPRGGFGGRLMCHAQVLVGLANDCEPEDVT